MILETPLQELQQYETLLGRMQRQMEAELERRTSENRIDGYYPDEGPLRRELYPKHLEFFRAGIEHRERCFLAANRVGKTEGVGGYELTCHLTGEYPDWWEGRTFDHPIEAWAAGDTSQTVRDIIQAKLLGPVGAFGTGLIRKELIGRTTGRQGIPDAVQDIYVKHSGGGTSWLTLKSYDQKRLSFQGTGKHVIWLDEEPDLGVYSECLLRTMTTNGLVICTFTPMLGLSEVVMNYLPEGRMPS
jgi:phage terminase large subunit-like protein